MADNGTSTERYQLVEPVGAGGMGTVWRGRDTLLDREVAIKVIALPDGLDGAEVYASAVREARAAARIRHPNVVPVHDVIVGNDGQPPWIIMDFVRGRPLDAVIRQGGPMSPARVADLGAQVLAGLAAGHAEGVLHRDLKPANVMITSEGQALVTDFGIAKRIGDPQWTQPGQVRGTPEYMAPERAWGEEGTAASDLFGLGATMFAAFRGQGPFHRDGVDAALDAARHDDPPRVPEAGPLAGLIHAMLSRDPARRPTAAQAAHGLDAVIKGAPAPVIQSAGGFPAGMVLEGMAPASAELPGWTSADKVRAGGAPIGETASPLTLTAPPGDVPGHHRHSDVPGAPAAPRLALRLRLRSRASRWWLAAVAFVAVAACIAGVIIVLPLTGGGVASEGFQITAAVNGSQQEAFAVTKAGVLEHNSFRNGVWSGWQPLPGGGRYLGAPATVTDSTGRLEVFARTANKAIVRYYQSVPGADSWDGPEQLGSGQFTGNPTAVNWPGHGLVVFARRTDGLMGIDSQADAGLTVPWSGWHSLGTIAVGQPVAVKNYGDGHPEVFAIASGGGRLVHAYNQGRGWKGWFALPRGGAFTGVPAVGEDATGRVEVLVATATGYLQSYWQEYPGHGSWNTAFLPVGSGIVGAPELIAVGGQLEVFAERADGSLEYSTQLQADSAEWLAWASLPGRVSGEFAVVYASERTDILANVGGSVCDLYSVGTSGWSAWRPLSGAS